MIEPGEVKPIANGQIHIKAAAGCVGLALIWSGRGVSMKLTCQETASLIAMLTDNLHNADRLRGIERERGLPIHTQAGRA